MGGFKNSKMLTDAYGGLGACDFKCLMLIDAYGGTNGWVGLKHLTTYRCIE